MCDLFDCKNCKNLCKENATDKELEKLWEEFEDITLIEAKDFYNTKEYENDIDLVLMSDWHGWEAGTSREEIWHWFDTRHSKGVSWLLYEYEPEEIQE